MFMTLLPTTPMFVAVDASADLSSVNCLSWGPPTWLTSMGSMQIEQLPKSWTPDSESPIGRGWW